MPKQDNADNITTTLDGENSKLPLATTSNEPETSAAIGSISTNSTEDEEIISTEALSLVESETD